MIYNQQCIYDILKYIEVNGKTPFKIINFNLLIQDLQQYDKKLLYNHIIWCQQTYLINKLLHSIHDVEFIIGISQKGKDYIESHDSSFPTTQPLYLFDLQKIFIDY